MSSSSVSLATEKENMLGAGYILLDWTYMKELFIISSIANYK